MFSRSAFWGAIQLLFVCLISENTFAKQRHPITWEESPKLHTIPDSLKKEPAIFVLEERRLEMQNGDEGYEQYYTVHHIVRLNDDKGVEAFNTFNIPVIGIRIQEIKARTVLPNGKVIEVNRDKIKKIKSESGSPEYLVAMEAVEPGAEVELLYTELLPGTASGREIFQYRVPIRQANFRLIVPEHMRYEAKGYNGFPTPKDSATEDQRSYSATAFGIPALDEETDSRYKGSLKRVDYKLSYVLRTENEKERRQTWMEMAKELHRRYIRIGDKDTRIAAGLLRKIGVEKGDDELKKIAAIEDYFKTSIAISDELSDESAEDFEQIIRKRISTEKGYVRLFAASLKAANVPFEVGMVGSRFGYELDDSLEIWSNLSEYCFYFPQHDSYLAPAAVTYRYPFLPFQMCGTRGVFTRTRVSSDGGTSTRLDIRTVPHSNMAQNGVGVNATVHFESKELLPIIVTTVSFKGLSSEDLRKSLLFSPKDKEKEIIQNIIGLSDKSSDLRDYSIENVGFTNYANGKALAVTATVQAPNLLEKAGPKYLFRAGELIGKQAELYDEEKRKLPVEIEYPNEQPRKLVIDIPAGYKVMNPEVFRVNVGCKIDGREVSGFHSDYQLLGQQLSVTVREFYERTSYPLSKYEDYRKVINAAADFNKIVLVLQKI